MPILEQSVKSLLMEMYFQETPLATGTGFLVEVRNGFALVTCRHNFTGRHQVTNLPLSAHGGLPDRVVVWQNSFNGLGEWHREIYPLLNANGDPLWREHPTLGAVADIVALPLALNALARPYQYNVGMPEIDIQVSPGDVLSVIGFPFGLTGGRKFAIWATGFLATEPDIDYADQPTFLVDCRSRPGQSGSPVVACRNGGMVTLTNGDAIVFGGPVSTLLGIYSGRINENSDLGIVWKRSAITELIATF